MTDASRPPSLGAAHTDLADYRAGGIEHADLVARRQKHFAGSMLFYDDPVHLVRGEGVWLFDSKGRRYLDCYNNVPSVGHCNPRVVEALARQAAQLNTHTRYLHETVLEYAERLAALFPGELSVCFFVCTGTEANELAMRIARAATGHRGAVVMEYAYHGNSTLIGELSTAGSRPDARPPHVVAVEPPDVVRGPVPGGSSAGTQYAAFVDDAIAELDSRGEHLAAFMCDAIFDSQGGLEAPEDYFREVYQRVRAAGGLCIADEVQPGFARTGPLWGFEHYNVVPDIVTLGKPIGNGHPLAAVVTTPEIAARFSRSEFYFNTFGGNPVSAAVGLAVLDELRDRDLPAHVSRVGRVLRSELEALMQTHACIGHVRGRGLYQALDIVVDRASGTPDAALARTLPDAMKDEGVLLGLSGRYGNVLKIRPPLVFDETHVEVLVRALDRVLSKTAKR